MDMGKRMASYFWKTLILLLLCFEIQGEIVCPPYQEIPFCSCFVLDDQLHVQCSGPDVSTLRHSLQVLNGPVKSFSVYDLDTKASVLPNGVTDNVTSPVYHLQISHSSLEDLDESSLRGLSKSLESLAIVSSRLRFIPQKTLSSLRRLKMLDLERNQVQELGPYAFHNILLQKLNLKGNLVGNLSEHAFWGLEETLMDLDLSENKLLKSFPYIALKKLRLLSSLNLAWNELSDLTTLQGPRAQTSTTVERESIAKKPGPSGAFEAIRYGLKNGGGLSSGSIVGFPKEKQPDKNIMMDWPLLKYLNLNSNYLRVLKEGTFSSMRNLRTLSIHLNSIEFLDPEVFFPLTDLESLDLSHNKLTLLPSSTFEKNSNLISIDLSNNHLHSVGEGLLQNLPELRELFLNGNNILRLLSPTFENSPRISILYLQGNSLRYVESEALSPLKNLTEIRLSDNFLRILPQDLFFGNQGLTSVSLDGNQLTKVAPGTFQNCKGLRELRLQNNAITSIQPGTLDTLHYLEEVHLENNKLNMVEGLNALSRIRHVTLSRNSLEEITGELLPGTELSSLSLGHNLIRTIQDGAFANQSTLGILFLGNNMLTRLGPRYFAGLSSLERLYLGKNNVSWIHPDCFSSQIKALQYLDLSYNALKEVNKAVFSGLASIEEINLSNNYIHLLEEGVFTHLRSLRIIDLSSNHLMTLEYTSVFHPGGLEILKMCCNLLIEFRVNLGESTAKPSSSVESLPKSPYGPVALKELDLHDNSLTGSVFRQIEMGRVEVLQISGNNLTDMDEATLEGFPSLNFFSGERAHITALPGTLFRSNGALAVIRLSDNFISHIPESAFLPQIPGKLSSSSPIRELHLRNNRLRAFPYKALANTTSLEVLTLSGNRINTLDLNRISLPRLKQLDMNDNRLGKISGSSLTKSMPLLQVVDFGENNISRVGNEFVRNLSLSQINFGGNSMDKVPYAFSDKWLGSGGSSGFVLNMSGNPLMNFYTEDHHQTNFSVMDLYLCDTNVGYLMSEEFKVYPRLHRLVIKRNPLSVLPPAAFSSLEHLSLLDLSENAIEEVKVESFVGLMQLKSLNLSRNMIKIVETFHSSLSGLQDLDLSENRLSHLAPESFANLASLVTLRLRGNKLTGLPADLFGPLARLAVLDLGYNTIQIIATPVLRHLETRISSLRLEGNPLSCECEGRELWAWLQSHPKVLASPSPEGTTSSTFLCQRPPELRGRAILEADLDSLCTSSAVLNVRVQDVQPSSALVSWQEGGNSSLMRGFMIGYHALDHDDRIRWTRPLSSVSRTHRLPDLLPDTPYLVCVLGLAPTAPLTLLPADTLLRDTPNSKCTRVTTSSPVSGSDSFSFLQRRLGVVVGAGVGVVLFFIFLVLFACVKLKKRRLVHRQGHQHSNGNGKSDSSGNNGVLIDARATPNATVVGIFEGIPHRQHLDNHSTLPADYKSTLTKNKTNNGNGTFARGNGNRSPDFPTYLHYSLTSEPPRHMDGL